jgi:hypothetical protein
MVCRLITADLTSLPIGKAFADKTLNRFRRAFHIANVELSLNLGDGRGQAAAA